LNNIEIIQNKIVPRDNIQNIRKTQKGKVLVFTNGCFDILHPGHIQYLAQARELGDFLWIGLNSDTSVKKLKGENRPVNTEQDRAKILAALFFVDFITVFSENTPIELIRQIKPEIHTKGGDYNKEDLPEYSIIREYGGNVEIIPFVKGKSTTSIIQKIQST